MSVFDEYSTYYDLLYKSKDYVAESKYVIDLLARHGVSAGGGKTLLDIGCGSGGHARHFAAGGFQVTGVDRSEGMIAKAKALGGTPNYQMADAQTFRLDRQFDAVVSLFHVMSYHTAQADLENAFNSAVAHVKPGGLFIFDFWYGPTVLNQLPLQRVLRVEDERVIVRRITQPVLRERDNVVDVQFEMLVQHRKDSQLEVIQEIHPMRYLFFSEIRSLATRAGVRCIAELNWMDREHPPTLNDRYALAVIKR